MKLEDVEAVLTGRPFLFSRLHDYNVVDGKISALGVFEDFLPYLREAIDESWAIIERRRNPDNNFVRVDIVKKSEENPMHSSAFN